MPGAWSPPGLGPRASAPPAGPPWRMTPIKRSSSCLVDNKMLFFFSLLQLVYCINVSAAQQSTRSSKPPLVLPCAPGGAWDPRGSSWMGCRTLPSSHGMGPQRPREQHADSSTHPGHWCRNGLGTRYANWEGDSSRMSLLPTASPLSHPLQGSWVLQGHPGPGMEQPLGPRDSAHPPALEADLLARSQGCLWWAGMRAPST